MIINAASEKKLKGVHPDLVRVVRRTAKDWKDPETGWIITCGIRSVEAQRRLVAKGASKTMRSRHLTGHAIDLAAKVNGTIRWDWPLYRKLAVIVKEAARIEGVPIEWGGDWRTLKDYMHWEIKPGTTRVQVRALADKLGIDDNGKRRGA